jgi:hypothetical protein
VAINNTGTGGTGATAGTPTLAVNSITVTNGGSGYSSAPTVSFNNAGTGGSGAAAGTPALTGSVASISVTAAGSGYTSMPAVSITGGGGVGATAAAIGAVNAITLTAAGSGYTAAPTISFAGGSGTGAAASSTLRLNSISVASGGSGYSSAPTVAINNTGTGGSGAAAGTPTIAGSVASLTLTHGGSGYTSVPTVSFGGSGSGASAVAVVGGLATGDQTTTQDFGAAAAAGEECSPLTEIVNGSTDRLFFGLGNAASGNFDSVDVISGFRPATTVAVPPALGGTSGIIADNVSAQRGVQHQGSSIYFTTLAAGASSLIASVSRSSSVVTVTTSNTMVLQVGQSVAISGVKDSSFNGTFTVTAVNPLANQFTYGQAERNNSSSGGSAASAGGNVFAVKLTQSIPH